ncbi:DUF3857 domain-containing protein [Marivirga sp. S37H4]|uniref:DUF3857 domain-containing protein n=1 Tax=Marivirga aurantiaca TaxID=2802615 RepID=A0A934X1C8_9BACT|nr:DUF3857 domain-containing protein [Marivirga aurantiaca]MBK6267168.1 DUF3857 domain-containing protein [Marivirga aurantiaca]
MTTTKLKSSLFLLFIGFTLSALAQDTTGFTRLNKTDFQVSDAFTENADAVILRDSGYSYYNENMELIFLHNTRVNILQESGKSWGNVRIPYNKEDSLINIDAIVYNLDGDKVISTQLKASEIKSDTIEGGIVETYFSLPNVKIGSIIEYTYTLKINEWQAINNWYFQNEVPVLKSTYSTKIPSFMLFYKNLEGVRGLDNLERSLVKDSVMGEERSMVMETYTMDSIPAFIPEQDIPGGDYFISKIKFHLAEYTLPGEETKFLLPESYEELAFNWAGDPYFKQVYSRSNILVDRINQIYHKEFSPLKNIQSFFYFIRNNFTEDISQESTELEDVYKTKRGSAQQINMLLTKILNQAGFDAYLIALSTIDNRPTYPEYPNFEVFNHFVSMVRVNGQNYFIDASDKNLLFNMLEPNSVNNSGLVISRTAPGFVPFEFNFQDKEQTVGDFTISDTATVSGTLEVKREGYSVYNFDTRFLSSNRTYNDYLIETLFSNLKWDIKKHEVNDLFEGNKVIKEYLEFKRPVDSIAKNYMRIKPIVFNEYEVNPFPEKERQNPLTIYTPILRKASYNYTIPEGWELKKVPQSRSFALNGNKARFMYNSKMNGSKLTIEYSLEVDQVIYMSSEYTELRSFFEMVVQLLNQDIILIK